MYIHSWVAMQMLLQHHVLKAGFPCSCYFGIVYKQLGCHVVVTAASCMLTAGLPCSCYCGIMCKQVGCHAAITAVSLIYTQLVCYAAVTAASCIYTAGFPCIYYCSIMCIRSWIPMQLLLEHPIHKIGGSSCSGY